VTSILPSKLHPSSEPSKTVPYVPNHASLRAFIRLGIPDIAQ
jgi:hypothetical protein